MERSPREPGVIRAFLFRHNPLYLLSALLMLAGYHLLTGPLRNDHNFGNLLVLFIIMNVYEFLVIALALVLRIRRPGHPHRFWLIGIAYFLMADPTFLTEAFAVAAPSWILVACSILLSGAKLTLLMRALGERILDGRSILRLLPFILIAAMPKHILTISKPPFGAISAWIGWQALAVVALAIFIVPRRQRPESSPQRFMINIADIFPLALAGTHLFASGFIGSITVQASYFSPLMLIIAAAAVARGRLARRWAGSIMAVATMFAALLSVRGLSFGEFALPGFGTSVFSGLSVVLAMSGMIYAGMIIAWRRWSFLAPLSLDLLLAAAGGNFKLLTEPMPDNRESWGVFLVALAFVSLIAGIVVTVRARHNDSAESL